MSVSNLIQFTLLIYSRTFFSEVKFSFFSLNIHARCEIKISDLLTHFIHNSDDKSKYRMNALQTLFLTWCSRFCTGSCRFLCSTMCQFRPAGPGSRNTWGIGCASSCPWCKGGNGLRFCPRSLHTASRTENLCPPVVAGCCLQDSPLSLKKTHTQERRWLSHPQGCCLYTNQLRTCQRSQELRWIHTQQWGHVRHTTRVNFYLV